MCLADVVFDVWNKAGSWKSMAQLLRATLAGKINIGRSVNQQDKEDAYNRYDCAKKDLLDAIEEALTAIYGVDSYIRELANTKPGEWTTALKSILTAFRSNILSQSENLTLSSCQQEWDEVLNELHERQRFLRNIDTSAFDNIPQEQIPTTNYKKKNMRGRPADTDKKADEQIFNAWNSGEYNKYADLAIKLKKMNMK